MDPWLLYEYGGAFTAFKQQCSQALQEKTELRAMLLREKGGQAGKHVAEGIKSYDGLFELKANVGPTHIRYFYFEYTKKRLIFVHACPKSDKSKMRREYRRAHNVQKTLLMEPDLLDEITQIH